MELVHPDGTRLGATSYVGGDRGQIVIAGATAVPQRFYRSLAQWLADELKVGVLTFDYRGVGASRHGPLEGFEANYRDWASDLAVAVEHAATRGPTVVIGHSFGGQAYGMTDAHARTLGLYTFGTGAGWSGWMTPSERLRVWALWNLLGPPLVASHGYLPFRRLGMGEDIPRGVYRDWRNWCRYPRYFLDDASTDFAARYARVTAPVVALTSNDDAWAPPASVAAMMSGYPNAHVVTVAPAAIGRPSIGHMGYVRPEASALRPALRDWVDARLRSAAAA